MTSTTETSPAPFRKPVRILVAEDSPLNQQVALKQLEKLGYPADAVSDGGQALEALARTRYDIILMDCQMPGVSGYEATWQIREKEKGQAGAAESAARIYIVAMTANREADTREKCLAAGMDAFINKPVQLAELEAAVLRALADQAANKAFEEVIDPVVIAGLRQLRTPTQPDPLAGLIELFFQEAPAQLRALQEAASANDSTSLARIINTATALKGSAANLGARALAALCEEIEQTAKNWTLADVGPLVERARQEFGRVQEALGKLQAAR